MTTTARRFLATLVTALAVLAAALASPAWAELGITSFDGGAFAPNGDVLTQAGARPGSASTTFQLTEVLGVDGKQYTTEELEDAVVDLPAGLVGNPTGVATCTENELSGGDKEGQTAFLDDCPPASQVGYLTVFTNGAFVPNANAPTSNLLAGIYNMEAPQGKAALFGFNLVGALYHFSGELVRDDGVPGNYRIRASSLNNPQTVPLSGASVTVWGVPADPRNDADRGNGLIGVGGGQPAGSCAFTTNPTCTNDSKAYPGNVRPFFTLPTSCLGPVSTEIAVTGWQGGSDSSSFLSHDGGEPPVPVGNTGCEALDFSPTLEARPTTNVADSPTGLDVDLHIPQDESCDPGPPVSCAPATAHLRDTTVTLPEGMTINPAGANGLGACSPAQIDLSSDEPATCPDASRVGRVEVGTPLLDHPVEGAVYVATPHDNPFDSLLAIYIVVEDPISGTVAKIAGKVEPDPQTGQLVSTFAENPQVPFEDFELHFKRGPHASLKTPTTCGAYSTTSELTSWAGQEASPQDDYEITQGPGGAPCAGSEDALPNSPAFDAGAVRPIAGLHTPFVLHLRRSDGTQRFAALTVKPPPGLVAKLAGTQACSEDALANAAAKSGSEEKSNPSCPSASEIGSVVAGAGAGPSPYYASGHAYLAGPYKGAPLSMAIVTPATAGPFDLGTVVIRAALHVDPKTAEITAVSDPIPQILQGIPLDVRTADVSLDRPDFILTGTSCNPGAVNGELTTSTGQTAALFSRFQLAECTRLGFKPRMRLRLKGGTTRSRHPALTAILEPGPGNANLASISVALPRSEFLEQAHIRTICTRVQFAADQCPVEAIYGEATVYTPLFDFPLSAHVYLRASDNPLPDLVPDLRGPASLPIKVESAGRTDSVRGGIRNSFDFVPDAPFTKLVVQLQGGRKGLLVNSRDICERTYRATVTATAHNGASTVLRPKLAAKCGKAQKGKHRKRRGGGEREQRRP